MQNVVWVWLRFQEFATTTTTQRNSIQVALKQICKNLIVYKAANAKKIVKMLGDLSYKVVITYLFFIFYYNSNKTNVSLDFYFYIFPLVPNLKRFCNAANNTRQVRWFLSFLSQSRYIFLSEKNIYLCKWVYFCIRTQSWKF